jgi:hypothetical protein
MNCIEIQERGVDSGPAALFPVPTSGNKKESVA